MKAIICFLLCIPVTLPAQETISLEGKLIDGLYVSEDHFLIIQPECLVDFIIAYEATHGMVTKGDTIKFNDLASILSNRFASMPNWHLQTRIYRPYTWKDSDMAPWVKLGEKLVNLEGASYRLDWTMHQIHGFMVAEMLVSTEKND